MIRGIFFCYFFSWLLPAGAGPVTNADSSFRRGITLPAMFGDNMVLQRGVRIPFWGAAAPGEQITVLLRDQKAETRADSKGKWMVRLAPEKAGGPLEVTIIGKDPVPYPGDTVRLKNVLIGEVWIASGQSNMEMAVGPNRFFGGVQNYQQEIGASEDPLLRVFTVTKHSSVDTLQTQVSGQWDLSDTQHTGGFTAVGYFFARELRKRLGVPVGIISTSWGASPAEAWTRREVLTADPELRSIADHWDTLSEAIKEKRARPIDRQKRPSSLYNGMIAPLIPYGIKGVIWYQGEGNTDKPKQYRKLFPAMISDWRRQWGQGDFPFLFVQLANFMRVQERPSEGGWAGLREAQRQTLTLPNTGMAVAIDIGEEKQIHARNKQEVGRRLALCALAQVYKHTVGFSGPMYGAMKVEGNTVRLQFKYAHGGLKAKEGKTLQGFAVAGKDRTFVWAQAKISGGTVIVVNPRVAHPVAVRYSWANNPIGNLYNGDDLPASPFRTDSWPEDFNIADFGARGDSRYLNTKPIQEAVDKCSLEGGRVIVPAGIFISGTIVLRDNVTLVLDSGAVLRAGSRFDDFPRQPRPAYRSQKDKGGWFALIYAAGAKNIQILGSGVIDGNGASQKSRPGLFGGDLDGRPRNLLFISCKNIRVEGISMRNSGMWNQHYLDCEDVRVDKIRVLNHGNLNNDGIDIDGCRRFTLTNSTIDSEDDGIVLKSTGPAACEDISIRHCTVSSHTNAIKCGTESTGGFKHISISDCVITPSKVASGLHYPASGITGISLEIVDGGVMDGVRVNNIRIEGTQCPIYVRLGNRARKYTEEAPVPPAGSMKNIEISDVTAYNTGNYSSSITGIPGARIENISLRHIRIVNSGGLKNGDYLQDIQQVREDETAYPQPNTWGNLPSYGLFIRHVRNISIIDAVFTSAAPDPRWAIVAAGAENLRVTGLKVNKGSESRRMFIIKPKENE